MIYAVGISGKLAFIDAAVIAVLGYGAIFAGLISLMLVVMALGKVFSIKKNTPSPLPVAPQSSNTKPTTVAPGSAGSVKLNNVKPQTAAMLMAIVADKTGKPLNELKFTSIKETE